MYICISMYVVHRMLYLDLPTYLSTVPYISHWWWSHHLISLHQSKPRVATSTARILLLIMDMEMEMEIWEMLTKKAWSPSFYVSPSPLLISRRYPPSPSPLPIPIQCTVLYCTVLYCTVLYCNCVLYTRCTVVTVLTYYTVLTVLLYYCSRQSSRYPVILSLSLGYLAASWNKMKWTSPPPSFPWNNSVGRSTVIMFYSVIMFKCFQRRTRLDSQEPGLV